MANPLLLNPDRTYSPARIAELKDEFRRRSVAAYGLGDSLKDRKTSANFDAVVEAYGELLGRGYGEQGAGMYARMFLTPGKRPFYRKDADALVQTAPALSVKQILAIVKVFDLLYADAKRFELEGVQAVAARAEPSEERTIAQLLQDRYEYDARYGHTGEGWLHWLAGIIEKGYETRVVTPHDFDLNVTPVRSDRPHSQAQEISYKAYQGMGEMDRVSLMTRKTMAVLRGELGASGSHELMALLAGQYTR